MTSKKFIHLFSPSIGNEEISASASVLKSKFWSSGAGIRKVLEFENKFKKFINSRQCVAVDSGTSALHLALNILDITNREVLVPSLTFVSTVHSIVHNGGIPIFVDVNSSTLNMDVADLEKKITSKTKVILPVHLGGLPCELNKISKIAKKSNLYLVDDAAHACGAEYGGKKIGSLCDLTCFSFHPVKNLAMPKGGAITINMKNHSKLKTQLNSLRWCGIENRYGSSYDVGSLGFNFYMDEISASIGLEQLKKLKIMNKKRTIIAKRYHDEINLHNKMPFDKQCSYHLYWIRIKNRNKFIKEMNNE
jgi:dTDP-4-amino-4,6-dideoxygalactose transaminase